jgi:hypothetical protein
VQLDRRHLNDFPVGRQSVGSRASQISGFDRINVKIYAAFETKVDVLT